MVWSRAVLLGVKGVKEDSVIYAHAPPGPKQPRKKPDRCLSSFIHQSKDFRMTIGCSRRQLLTELPAASLALFGVLVSAKATTCGERQARDADPHPVAVPGWEPRATTYTYPGGAVGTVSGAGLGTVICYDFRPAEADSGARARRKIGVGSVPYRV
jgi:hypothetical protein